MSHARAESKQSSSSPSLKKDSGERGDIPSSASLPTRGRGALRAATPAVTLGTDDRSIQDGLRIQPKLTVNEPDGKYEREAERVSRVVTDRTATPLMATDEMVQETSRGEELRIGLSDGKSQWIDDRRGGAQPPSVGGTEAGRPLSQTIRGWLEARFGCDLGAVRVHTGPDVDRAADALEARAFTVGTDVAIRRSEYRPGTRQGRRLLAHEVAHVIQQTAAGTARIDRQPASAGAGGATGAKTAGSVKSASDERSTGSGGQGEVQTVGQLLSVREAQAAIRYNEQRFHNWGMELVQDMVGAPVTGTADRRTVRMVTQWQRDHGLTVDGKVGRYTLQPIVEAYIDERFRNKAIHLVIDGHNLDPSPLPRGRFSVFYDQSLPTAGKTLKRKKKGPKWVKIGPSAFGSYEELVHTLAHEMEHVHQPYGMGRHVKEFRGEATEVLSAGMQLESVEGMMGDATRLLFHWNQMSAKDRYEKTNTDLFNRVREEVRRRLNALPPAKRHQKVGKGLPGYKALSPRKRRNLPTFQNILDAYDNATNFWVPRSVTRWLSAIEAIF